LPHCGRNSDWKPSTPTPLSRHIPKLPPTLIQSLSNPIELSEVISTAASTRSPSAHDGIPYRLYSAVPALHLLLLRVIHAALSTGRFPPSWAISYFRPILKPDQNAMLPSSYRPIALLCCDYKIFSFIITSRLPPYLPSIFPTHQSGYIPNRSTHHGALRVAHLIRHTPKESPLLLDSEKAYDRVAHEWLLTYDIQRHASCPLAADHQLTHCFFWQNHHQQPPIHYLPNAFWNPTKRPLCPISIHSYHRTTVGEP